MTASIHVTGACTACAGDPVHPKFRVAEVVARFPAFVPELGRDVGGTSGQLSMQRWAMYGSGLDLPWFVGPLEEWLVDSAVALGAETGYVSLDKARAGDDQSAWERRARFSRTLRDPRRSLWGYGWGTLLSLAHRDLVGGVERLGSVPGARVREVAGDRTWLTLGPDPAQVPDSSMWALHEVLVPALPAVDEEAVAARVESQRQVDSIAASGGGGSFASALRAGPPSAASIRRRWEADAKAARAAGRRPGPWGPLGFTLDAGVPEIVGPFVTFGGPELDLVWFSGLGAQAAAMLLDRLGPATLDESSGSGPSLRAALSAAIAHPGVVLVQGHAVGPGREDERITVEGVHVVGDPVLTGLGAGDLAQAWARVVELGIDDADSEPDELRPPDDEDDEPGAAPGAWTVWWD
ncbi:MAG: hypothetical protein ACOH17_15795 [Cellulomonas sp.]